jgi:hypothetical protein
LHIDLSRGRPQRLRCGQRGGGNRPNQEVNVRPRERDLNSEISPGATRPASGTGTTR